MREYCKIHSIYLRDPENKMKTFIEGAWTLLALLIVPNLSDHAQAQGSETGWHLERTDVRGKVGITPSIAISADGVTRIGYRRGRTVVPVRGNPVLGIYLLPVVVRLLGSVPH